MKPVIVPDTMSADTANNLYGERYGVDWQYAPPSVKVPANTLQSDSRAPSIIPAVALYLTILAMAIILVLIFAGGAHA